MHLIYLLVAAVVMLPITASAQSPTESQFMESLDIPGVPHGPYSEWSGADRKQATISLVRTCGFMCVDRYAGGTPAPDEMPLRQPQSKVCMLDCTAAHLPADHPERQKLIENLRSAYKAAKELGSDQSMPEVLN